MTYKRLPDGAMVELMPDGGFRPVATRTDWQRLALMSDDEIERLASSDPDHPALDDDFWAAARPEQPTVVRLEPEVAAEFRPGDPEVERRVNSILRDYFGSKRAAS